jgi:hypothetical protein
LNSIYASQVSTAPSQTKSDEKLTNSLSLEYIPLATFGKAVGFLAGLKLSVFKPSKQSPKNSQTFGGLVPLDKIVKRD